MRPIGPRTVVFSLADFRVDLRGIAEANELEFEHLSPFFLFLDEFLRKVLRTVGRFEVRKIVRRRLI